LTKTGFLFRADLSGVLDDMKPNQARVAFAGTKLQAQRRIKDNNGGFVSVRAASCEAERDGHEAT
jgi:hypothetical protein